MKKRSAASADGFRRQLVLQRAGPYPPVIVAIEMRVASFQHDCIGRLAAEDVAQQVRRISELVGFEVEAPVALLVQRQRAAQVVLVIGDQQVLEQSLFRRAGKGSIVELLVGDIGRQRQDVVEILERVVVAGFAYAPQLKVVFFGRLPQPVVVSRRPVVGEAGTPVADEGLGLRRRRIRGQRRVGNPARIGHLGRFKHVAVFIEAQIQRMRNTRIAGIAFVLIGNDLTVLGREDGVAVLALRLQQLDDAIVGGDREGRQLLCQLGGRGGDRGRIEREHFGT